MTLFGRLFKNVTNGISSFWNKLTGVGLTAAQKSTMSFNAYQADLDRQFQSAEAEKARQWQEEYYNQYESPAARMRLYESAGLNSALMYGGASSGSSVPSTSVPSGSAASSSMPSDSVDSLLSTIMSAVLAKSQINKNNADAKAANSNARNTDQLTQWQPKLWESQLAKNEVDCENMRAGIAQLQAQTQQIFKNINLTDAQISKVLAEADNIEVDTAKKELEKQGVEINNKLLASKVLQTYAETRLTAAQTVLTKANTETVNLTNTVQAIDTDMAKYGNGSRAKSWPELLDKAAARLDKSLSSLWQKIF